jgi:cytochrome P450
LRIRTPRPLKPLKRQIGLVLLHGRLLLKAMAKSAKLPPGELDSTDREMHTDRHYVIKKSKKLGPIFKMMWNDQYTTCIYGHKLSRKLVMSDEDNYPGATVDFTGLFAIGALRGMSGETHKKYRRVFVQALQGTPLAYHETAVRQWIRDKLDALAASSPDHRVVGPALRAGLREITSGIMLRLLFGITPDMPDFEAITREYRQFGPDYPIYNVKPANAEAFKLLRTRLTELAERIRRGPSDSFPPTFIKQMVEGGSLDETAFGNLIFMHEPSHFDLLSLWRWMVHLLATNPHVPARVRATPAGQATELCKAITFETIRLEQLEELYRKPNEDAVFEGYLIPKGTIIRGRLWEGHKDETVFPEPFKFDPDRFIGKSYGIEQYAPFGLDKRRCVGADLVIALTTMFAEALLRNFTIEVAEDGPAVFGAYHWEPAPNFAITLTPVAEAALSAARA